MTLADEIDAVIDRRFKQTALGLGTVVDMPGPGEPDKVVDVSNEVTAAIGTMVHLRNAIGQLALELEAAFERLG